VCDALTGMLMRP